MEILFYRSPLISKFVKYHSNKYFGHKIRRIDVRIIWIILPWIQNILLKCFRVVSYKKHIIDAEKKYESVLSNFIGDVKNSENPEVLEIGSRVVTGKMYRQKFGEGINYVGFDIREGKNVDVTGDAHKLSTYFPDKKFDFIYSIAVFEHIMMPWKVVLEMNKILNTGGKVFTLTTPNFPPHELPWDFFRFSRYSFDSLFNASTGFKLVEVEEGVSGRMIGLSKHNYVEGMHKYISNIGVCAIAEKISEPESNLNWDVDINDLTDTMYPPKK